MSVSELDCRYCGDRILMLPCSDGRWRTFVPEPVEVTDVNVRACWVPVRRRGMTAGDPYDLERVPRTFPRRGLVLHTCAEYLHSVRGHHPSDPDGALDAILTGVAHRVGTTMWTDDDAQPVNSPPPPGALL